MPDLAEPSLLSDQQLVRQALAAPDMFALLVRRYEARIRRYIYRLGQTGAAQDDVTQNIFLHAWVNLNGYDQSRPFAPWLWRIAYTQTMMHFRTSRPARMEMSGDDFDALIVAIATEGSPENFLDHANLRSTLTDALDGLSEKARSVLILRYLEDCTYLEIAEVLHIPSGTVATLIHRGLRDLKATLARAGMTSITRWSLP